MQRLGTTAATILLAIGGLAACSGNDGPALTTAMDSAQAAMVAGQASDLFSPTANGLLQFDPDEAVLGLGYLIPTGPSTPVARRPLLGRLRLALAGRAPGCDPVQSDPTDSDGDGIFDDNTITFTAGNCTTTDGDGNPLVVSGTIRIREQDGLFGWLVDLTSLNLKFGDATSSTTFLANGYYQAVIGGLGASARQKLSLQVTDTEDGVYAFTDNWVVTYTPDNGQEIVAGGPLPAGAFGVTGAFTYTRSGAVFRLTLVTALPLTVDGVCTGHPPFTGGQVVGTIDSHPQAGFLITYTGCGLDPLIEARTVQTTLD